MYSYENNEGTNVFLSKLSRLLKSALHSKSCINICVCPEICPCKCSFKLDYSTAILWELSHIISIIVDKEKILSQTILIEKISKYHNKTSLLNMIIFEVRKILYSSLFNFQKCNTDYLEELVNKFRKQQRTLMSKILFRN